MKKFLFFILLVSLAWAGGLENFFNLILKDKNGDGIFDSSAYSIVLDENDLYQLEVATEIAYRLGFESGEYIQLFAPGKRKIIIKRNRNLPSGIGQIRIEKGNIYIEGNDNLGLLATREFLWRFPYVWKTSKYVGKTWENVKYEIEDIFKNNNIKTSIELVEVKIRGKSLPFSSTYLEKGEVVEAIFKVKGNLKKLKNFIKKLEESRKKGEDSYILNFPYIEKLIFVNDRGEKVVLKRWGGPEEFFRPSYGNFLKKKKKGKPPEVTKLLNSPIAIVLEKGAGKGAVAFAFRAGLEATEAHFPVAFLSDNNIPPSRAVVVIGKGKLFETHILKEPSRGLCIEKGEKYWYLSPKCAGEFSESFLFPAFNKDKNLYFSKFFLEKLRFWIPQEAQEVLAKGTTGEPYIAGKIYGKHLIYRKEIKAETEVEQLKKAISGINYTKLIAYLSEPPEVRKSIEKELGPRAKIRSSYKAGFFWIKEEVIPYIKGTDRIIIHVKKTVPGKFEEISSSPDQFLYELYPIDDVISRETKIPVKNISFVLEEDGPLYRVEVFRKGEKFKEFILDPPIVKSPFPRVEARVLAWQRNKQVLSKRIKTEPEIAWEFYREKFLPWLKKFILKKTGGKPTWDKQPFFSYIEINFQASEPDFPLGIDYEIISSTEALHDELYFYTLYYISRLLKPAEDGGGIRAHLYPGAIIPLIRSSRQGFKFEIKVYDYRKPGVYRKEKAIAKFYPMGKVNYEILGLDKERLWAELKFEKEDDFILYSRAFSRINKMKFPVDLILTLKYKDIKKTYSIHGKLPEFKCTGGVRNWSEPIPPEDAECQVSFMKYSYPVAESFLGRRIFVVEKVTATTPRYSASHFMREKPAIVFNARQHANEVSSTTYLLDYLLSKKLPESINFIANPMENPDGAAIAIMMIKKENPLHSLHAGRYNALGTDIGFHLKEFSPYAPEGYVRPYMLSRWMPDIHLNLHGYPSHEWVHQFTGYLPFPYRNYWIPRGHFFYFSSQENPINITFSNTSLKILKFVTTQLSRDKKINYLNKIFYNRYFRWANRWNPHAFKMEIENNYNVYWKTGRRIGFKTSPFSTLVSEVPEYIDETARGKLLDYLKHCGEKYIKAHADYLIKNRKKPDYIFNETSFEIKVNKYRKRW